MAPNGRQANDRDAMITPATGNTGTGHEFKEPHAATVATTPIAAASTCRTR